MLVSIIIAAYNTGDYIESTLGCCLSQTYTDIEVIVVNDGSTDNTAEIAKSFCGSDPRVKLIEQENLGVSAARNLGLSFAHGDKILFFDSDDTFESSLVEKCIDFSIRNDVETVLFGHADGTILAHEEPHRCHLTGIYRDDEILEKVLPAFLGISFREIDEWIAGNQKLREGKEHSSLWHVLFDRNVISSKNLSFDINMSLGEDTKFLCQYLLVTKSIGVINECLYYLRPREGSLNASNNANPILMLDNKVKVIKAKCDISLDAQINHQIELWPYWRGTILLSAIQLSLAICGRNGVGLLQGRRQLRSFMALETVQLAIEEYKPPVSFKALPFHLIKARIVFPFLVFGRIVSILSSI